MRGKDNYHSGMRKMTSQTMSKELQRKQSSTSWQGADMQDYIDQDEDGNFSGMRARINEKYLHEMSGDASRVPIDQLVKPLDYVNLNEYGTDRGNIFFIIDVQLIELRASQTLNVLVLYRGDIEKVVGTRARHPVCKLAIFQLVPLKTIEGREETDWQPAGNQGP